MRIRLLTWIFAAQASLTAVGQELDFVVIGDTRPRFESESFKVFETLISRINSLHPALVINLGDLIYGYGPISKDKQWDRYDAVVRNLESPYFQVPGNHDTHSKQARTIYQRRYRRFYQSFDRGENHFVLLDNSEEGRWGYMSPAQLTWLRKDLEQSHARNVFVFVHFPVWEPDRITPAYFEFWEQTLHPLFRKSRVRAVFGGHYHTYGPTREFDGIRYYITGGGGAELRPEYRKSGGQYHFMKVKALGENIGVRVITEHGEISDSEADVMGGLLFASRQVSRIGIKCDPANLRCGTPFAVRVNNPYSSTLSGQAFWVLDSSVFRVEPHSISLRIPAFGTQVYEFSFSSLQDAPSLQSLPRLEFNLNHEGRVHRFHREVRLLQEAITPFRETPPILDGNLKDWLTVPRLLLGEAEDSHAELHSGYDRQNLYLALSVPEIDGLESKESGLSDEVEIGIAKAIGNSEFGPDLLRVGLNSDSRQVADRTPNRRSRSSLPGATSFCTRQKGSTIYEVSIPLKLLGKSVETMGGWIIDLSFPQPDRQAEAEPGPNTFSYRVLYGSDSLVPVYFVELNLQTNAQKAVRLRGRN